MSCLGRLHRRLHTNQQVGVCVDADTQVNRFAQLQATHLKPARSQDCIAPVKSGLLLAKVGKSSADSPGTDTLARQLSLTATASD